MTYLWDCIANAIEVRIVENRYKFRLTHIKFSGDDTVISGTTE